MQHELVGKKVITGFGEATVTLYIASKDWFKVEYPDGSMGWCTRQQITPVA